MNLGDGLLFELDNGKPKLILLSRGVEKNAAKLICRPRAANILSIKQPTCVDEVQVKERPVRQWTESHREIKTGVAVSFTSNPTNGRRSTALTSTKSHDYIKGETGKVVAKVKSDKHSSAIGSLKASEKTGRPQKSGTGGKIGLQENVAGRDADVKDSVNSLTSEQLQKILSSVETTASDQDPPADLKTEGMKTGSKCDSSMNDGEGGRADMTVTSRDEDTSVSGGLFSWLEERHSESRAAIDHRKAQWKRELDEQVAIKQQKQLSAPGRLQADKAVSVLSVQSSIRHKQQPAALRSSLMLGEVTPMEEVLSVKRKEEQRRHWLEELDKQREETTERRRREKLLQSQSEDHDLWASHFDSLKKRPHFQTVAPLPGPLISSEEEPLSRLSLVSEAMSTIGPESVQGASVDTTSGYQTRTSYLRNMTALLDPTQLEERERRRIRRLEQQQAIEAQVKERQQQREQEEVRKRQEEEEEERRLAVEREILERRYKLDTMKERKKEHPSPQVEQPNKGYGKETHQKTLEIKTITREDKCLEEVSRLTSTYKDTAVQTEAVPSVPRTDDGVHTAHISTQCQPHPLSAAAPNRKNQIVKRGKENICAPGGGERRGGDPYEAFARTDRGKKDRTKPDWNTQRPGRQFVPASERYPASQQKNRQESRMKRQAELLALQGRTCLSRTNLPPPRHHHLEPHLSPDLTQTRTSPSMKLESVSRGHSSSANIHVERGHSPTIPTVIHRIQNLRDPPSTSPPLPPPPPAQGQEFVPYIRTWEVFNLDPLESADTPPPRIHNEAPPAPSHPDRTLRPELICNTHRQQETLRGLAQLRQGLLQKQRELAMDPLLKRYETKPC